MKTLKILILILISIMLSSCAATNYVTGSGSYFERPTIYSKPAN